VLEIRRACERCNDAMVLVVWRALLSDLKNPVLEDINELINELSTIYHDVAAQSLDHIHAKYVLVRVG